MRRICLPLLISFVAAAAFPQASAQAPTTRGKTASCEQICNSLMASIERQPDTLVMRLEDALVMRESCAAEIVQAAMTAVAAQPALVDEIVRTAVKVAPSRRASILYAARHFQPMAPAALPFQEEVEIRRAVIPAAASSPADASDVVEVRRALPATPSAPAPPPPSADAIEVRKALPASAPPTEEIRRATVPSRG